MFKPHAIIDFSHFTQDEIAPTATVVANSLTTNAAAFTGLPVTGAALTTLITTYAGILGRADYAGKAADLAAARLALNTPLRTDGIFVNGVANGNEVLLAKSGYPLAKAHEPVGPLSRSVLSARSTDNPGEFSFKIEGVKHERGFLLCYTPVTNPENDPTKWSWQWCPSSSGLLKGLSASTKYKLSSVGLGTDPSLSFSDVIERTTQ